MQDVVQKWSNYSSIELSGSVFPRTNQNKSPFPESGVLSSFFLGVDIVDSKSFTVSPAISKVKAWRPNLKLVKSWMTRLWEAHFLILTQNAGVENKNEFICFSKKHWGEGLFGDQHRDIFQDASMKNSEAPFSFQKA